MLEWYNSRKRTVGHLVESEKNEFALQLNRILESKNMTRRELASQLNTSPAYISKVLRGDANVTIESMVKLTHAAGGTFHCCITDKNDQVQWRGIVTGGKKETQPTVVKPRIETHEGRSAWAR